MHLFQSTKYKSVLQSIRDIGQFPILFQGIESANEETIRDLLEQLVIIDDFYREMGGIVGYQTKIIQLLKREKKTLLNAEYHSPIFFDIQQKTEEVEKAILAGIESLPIMAEIYPLGGAADRLHLIDEKTGQELPAAKLTFAGKTLLEHLIRDVEARENLYFQKYAKKIITPIAIMTSHEKNNHAHVIEICETSHWFNRPKDSFRFFVQPLVPTVDEKGNWIMTAPLKPLFKPGGHGAIWKMANDAGIFSWLEGLGRKKALIRQINNPIAGLDYGLLAFSGYGCMKNYEFGFASCPRLVLAAEGINVLIEKEDEIGITNIEYCDFTQFGIEDRPLQEGGIFSRFSSNTNILFADLKAIGQALARCPFPGLLINMKKGMARLESTMQNIADVFGEKKGNSLETKRTFVTYNHRYKTISTAKKAYVPGGPLQETPENCFYDLLHSHRELLNECGFTLPTKRSIQEYLTQGPEFLFLYHPLLGPFYSLIKEKLQKGSLSLGSELILEISKIRIRNVSIQGSLQILAENPLLASCTLENVSVINTGIDWEKSKPFWKMDLHRKESLRVILKGKSEWIARNLELKGNQTILIENGQIVKMEG